MFHSIRDEIEARPPGLPHALFWLYPITFAHEKG
jgi:hypothetical protein